MGSVLAKCERGHSWPNHMGWISDCPVCRWAAVDTMPIARQPMTCVRCWEEGGVNNQLALVSQNFDNRSVETKSVYTCPVCGHNTGVLPT